MKCILMKNNKSNSQKNPPSDDQPSNEFDDDGEGISKKDLLIGKIHIMVHLPHLSKMNLPIGMVRIMVLMDIMVLQDHVVLLLSEDRPRSEAQDHSYPCEKKMSMSCASSLSLIC